MSPLFLAVPEHGKLMLAVAFAADAHIKDKRKGKGSLSYIYHPIHVATNLIKVGITDLDTLIAALLHDVIEDTSKTRDEIAEMFGDDVADLVEKLTDDDVEKSLRRKLQIEAAKLYDERMAAIRVSDKIDNIISVVKLETPWKKERIIEYKMFAIAIIDAIDISLYPVELKAMFDDAVRQLDLYLAQF